MSNDYAELARKIIKDSIVSSVYIDDQIVEPFEDINGGGDRISKGLYRSFRKANKSLDFYRFQKNRDWQADRDYLFKNRDLLILDWELDSATGDRQEITLQILEKAILTENLHFVSIYTSKESTKFEDYFYAIKACFTKEFTAESQGLYKNLIEILDNEGIETAHFIDLRTKFKAFALLGGDRRVTLYKSLKLEIQQWLGEKYRIFAKGLGAFHQHPETACEILGFCINGEVPGTGETDFSANVSFVDRGFILISDTIIQITNKKEPSPEELFGAFTEAVLRVCGNLLTLVRFEIRSLLRESSGFIGKDANSMEDAALFHQKEKKADFFEFITDIFKNQTSSHFDYKNGKISSLTEDFWKGYYEHRGVKAMSDRLKAEEKLLHTELGKLNVYWNDLYVRKDHDDLIRFGDVFQSFGEDGKPDGNFFLCITAHCDCLRPKDNIKNNFYFILGAKAPIAKALGDADGGHWSYVRLSGEPVAIGWGARPTVLTVPDSRIDHLACTDGLGNKYRLLYISTLKESYAQRMANHSFGFAMRVGVDFASL